MKCYKDPLAKLNHGDTGASDPWASITEVKAQLGDYLCASLARIYCTYVKNYQIWQPPFYVSYYVLLYESVRRERAWPGLLAKTSCTKVAQTRQLSSFEFGSWMNSRAGQSVHSTNVTCGELSNFTIELVVDLIWFDSSMSRKLIFLSLPLMLVSNNLQCAFISSAQNSWSLGISAQQDSNDPSSCLGFMLK